MVDSFSSASPASSGVQDVTTVISNGYPDANLFDVNYYLSADPSITTDDVLLKSTHLNGLVFEQRTL